MKVVILDSGYKSYRYENELFTKNNIELYIHPSYHGEQSEKIKFAKNADGILIRNTLIDNNFLSEMKNLKAIVRYGIGFDNIDLTACSKFGVKVANVQGYASHSVSDHALALLFSCSRGMWNTSTQLTNNFAAPPVEDIIELHDKTLGIIGLGRIGSKLAIKASVLFEKIIACDPYKPNEHFNFCGVKKASLAEVAKKSHIISLHCNLSRETYHIISSELLSIMKNKPIIINTSRGKAIDEKALLEALNNGIIHSAGLDVFENEPISASQQELILHPRTICTGHYAWYSKKSAIELQKRAAQNLLNLLLDKEVDDSLN